MWVSVNIYIVYKQKQTDLAKDYVTWADGFIVKDNKLIII